MCQGRMRNDSSDRALRTRGRLPRAGRLLHSAGAFLRITLNNMITIILFLISSHYKLELDERMFLGFFLDMIGIVCTCAILSELISRI